MQHRQTRRPLRHARRGLTTPLVAVALLLAMMGLALIADRLWLDAAQLELTTAGEAAALSAARALASDELLRTNPDNNLITNRALDRAVSIAEQNTVAGIPVSLDLAAGDVQFGTLVTSQDTGQSEFVQTDSQPNQVRITLHRSRSRGNPLALFLTQLTHQPWADVVANVGAGLDNNVVGLRPFSGGPIPAIPLAIWQTDNSGSTKDTWQIAIEQRAGADNYGYDPDSQTVTSGADGIPEITLRSMPSTNGTTAATPPNIQLLDLGTGLETDALQRQFTNGIASSDLQAWNGELRTDSSVLTVDSTPALQSSEIDALESLVGEPRIAFLYSAAVPRTNPLRATSTIAGFVAIRVLAVKIGASGAAEIIAQPTVLTTRTALTDDSAAAPNRYIYRLTLTR